jgi:hypothetical protein
MTGSVTVFTTTTPTQLGKVYAMHEGQISKTVAGNMCEGTYEVHTFGSREDVATLLQSIGTNQAISNSLPRTEALTGRVVTAALATAQGCLARTKADFVFKSVPGLLTLDYDPPKGAQVLSRDELWARLLLICPEAAHAGAVWWCSGSSHIHGPTGELWGLRGQRLYVLIRDMTDIARAGQVLADRCWLNSLGRVEISTSGSRMLRSLWDEAMHQPARLDFIGGSICEPPLFQQRGEPVLMGGTDWLDTRTAFAALTETERANLERLQQDAKNRAQPQADEMRERWVSARATEEAQRLHRDKKIPKPEAMEQGRRLVESALSGTLYGDFKIPLAGNQFVTVAEVLDQWQEWDKKRTLDPLEPEHRNYEECGKLYLTGAEARLFTFAHGGMTFRLARQPVRVLYRKGRLSAVADELAQALSSQGDIYYSGETDLVQALPGNFKTLERTDVQYLLGHRVALVTKRDGKDVPLNIPAELVSLTYAAMGQKPNQTPPLLQSVTNLPYATPNRRLVTQPGFDAETGIYNVMVNGETGMSDSPTRETCIDALRTIWAPWSDYRWASDTDRGGMLAAIFTAVLRPAMATAPGVFFDAPVQASGKTKAALALGALMTGAYVGVYTFADGRNLEEEFQKSIIAMLRSERRFWLIDNVTGRFESAVLAGLITSGRVQGRILGMSKEGDFSGRVLLCATGNNATLGSDLNRRFLRCRIDTGVERPSDISHSFEPAQVAKDNRVKIAFAVLELLRAYWQVEPVTVTGGADFHEWSKVVREPIVWLQRQGLTEAADIGAVDDPAKALGGETTNPEQLGLQQLLEGVKLEIGCNQRFQSRELHSWYVTAEHSTDESKRLIREGVENLAGGKLHTPRSLSHVLLNRRDRRVAGLRLAKVAEDRNGVVWQVRND